MEKKEAIDWKSELENLCAELRAGEAVYATVVTADIYPHKREYFKARHFQWVSFAKVLEEELYTLASHKPSRIDSKSGHIFKTAEHSLLEKPLTDRDVDALVIELEYKLILRYREILKIPHMPDTTKAILQSQEEKMNNEWQKMQSDFQIDLRKESKPTGH